MATRDHIAGVTENKGQAEFKRIALPVQEVARRLGITANTVSRIRSGHRHPSSRLQEKIYSEFPSITPALWGLPLSVEVTGTTSAADLLAAAEDPAEDLPPIAQDTPAAMAARLLKHARGLEVRLATAIAVNDPDAHRQLNGLTRTVQDLAKVSGTTLTVRAILESNAWRLVEDKIRAALSELENGPEVAALLLDALEDLE